MPYYAVSEALCEDTRHIGDRLETRAGTRSRTTDQDITPGGADCYAIQIADALAWHVAGIRPRGLRLPQLVLRGLACTADYNRGLVHQFRASFIQLAIFLGQLVRRIVHQFSTAFVQVFAQLGKFLAGIDNVLCSIFSFTAKSAASSRA